jgi:polyisoprenoid-binding protein YceI
MTEPQPDVSAAQTPAPGSYRLDPERCTIRADVKAMFGVATVHGTFRLLTGEITVGDEPAGSSVQASIATDSYASGNAARDKDVTSANLLDAKAYPQISFDGSQVRPDGAEWVVSGTMTAHGTGVPAELRVHSAVMEDGAARFRVTGQLDRISFGVVKKKGMVGRAVDLSIDAVGVPSQPSQPS